MRMYHPDLPYTKESGHPTTEAAFRLAWEPKGWLAWPSVDRPVARKKGGPVKAGQNFKVGEHGPESMIPDTDLED